MDRAYGIQTLLMTDVVGSTRLWAAHPAVMPAAIERLEALAQEAVAAEGGELVKRRGEGDSLFCLFATPVAAARSAIALVRSLEAEPWPSGLELRVRAAIHCGPAHERDGDLFGPVPNRCARLREVGHGGQILLSGAARAHVAPHEALGLVDLGRHRLRDLDEPESVWQVGNGEHPPLRSLTSLRNNLPTQFTRFIGRDALRRDLVERIGSDRLTTLTGAGGSGKTRLALQLGADTIDLYPHGVWFVELAALSTEAAVVRAIGEACGFPDLVDAEGGALLTKRLADNDEMLLVLDNAEHALGAIGKVVAAILKDTRSLRVVVTSREQLRLRGERVHRVPPLETPPGDVIDPQAVGKTEAGALFVDRAALHLPEFVLRASNAAAVGAVVRRLDGIPLCVEMAASHVGYLSPSEILARLNDRFALLDTDDVDVPPRHRTMRETIAWQYDTLVDEEKLLLQRLAAFAGSFSLAAAETVGGEPPLDPDSVVRRLRALVDKSLVVATPDGDETRFRLLETIAQYAADAPEGETEAAMRPLFEWALRTGQAGYEGLFGRDHEIWLARLDGAEASIRRALDWALLAREARSAALATVMARYWNYRMRLVEGQIYLKRAAALGVPDSRMALMNALGVFSYKLGDNAEALIALEEILNDSELEPSMLAKTLTNYAILLNETGRNEEARQVYERALGAAEAAEDGYTARLARYNLGLVLIDLEEHTEAERVLTAVLKEYVAASDRMRQALCLQCLGQICVSRDDVEGARRMFAEALDAASPEPDEHFLSDALLDAAWLASARNEAASAVFLMRSHQIIQRRLASPVARRKQAAMRTVRDYLVQVDSEIDRSWSWRAETATRDEMLGQLRRLLTQ